MTQKTIAIKGAMRSIGKIIEHEPFNFEYTAESLGRMRYANNVFAEKHSKTIILKPNLEPIDMDGKLDEVAKAYRGSWYTMTGGNWDSRDVFGSPRASVEHQRGVERTVEGEREPVYWKIDTDPVFHANQGFVVWMNKYLLPYGWNNCLIFYLHNEDETKAVRIAIGNLVDEMKFQSREIRQEFRKERWDLMIEHWNKSDIEQTYPFKGVQAKDRQTEFLHLPGNFSLYKWSGRTNLLVVMMVDRHIIIGTEGMENTVAIRCNEYDIGRDKHNNPYPLLTEDESILTIWGYGATMLGFKPLHYEKQGSLRTNYIWLQEDPALPEITCHRAIVPENTNIRMIGKWGREADAPGMYGNYILSGLSVTGEENPVISQPHKDMIDAEPIDPNLTEAQKAELKKQRARERRLREYQGKVTDFTPIIYRMGLRQEMKLKTVEVVETDLPETILSYDESMSGDVAGDFWGGHQTIELSCYKKRLADVHKLKGQETSIQIKPYDKEDFVHRGRFVINNPSISTVKKNKIYMGLEGEDILSILRREKFKNSISLDDRQYTHKQMMAYLINGLLQRTLIIGEGDDWVLPISEDRSEPNWKTVTGTSIIEFVAGVLEHTKWLLYPDRNGNIVYRPRPTKDTTADFSINAVSDIIGEPKYQFPDELLKTRISLIGRAGADKEGEYKQGDALIGVAYNKAIERAIGKSIIAQPINNVTFSNLESIRKRVRFEYDLMTCSNVILNFQLRNFEDFFNMYLFDVINWYDPVNTEYSGKYLVIKTDLSIRNRILNYANIQGVSLWEENWD